MIPVSAMPAHKAYILSKLPAELTINTVETPTPTSGQVLLKVLATPILNYTSKVVKKILLDRTNYYEQILALH